MGRNLFFDYNIIDDNEDDFLGYVAGRPAGIPMSPHSSLDEQTPDQDYFDALQPVLGRGITGSEIDLSAVRNLFKQIDPPLMLVLVFMLKYQI